MHTSCSVRQSWFYNAGLSGCEPATALLVGRGRQSQLVSRHLVALVCCQCSCGQQLWSSSERIRRPICVSSVVCCCRDCGGARQQQSWGAYYAAAVVGGEGRRPTLLPPISAAVSTPPCTMHNLAPLVCSPAAHRSSEGPGWDLCCLDRSVIAHNMDKIANMVGVCSVYTECTILTWKWVGETN